MQRNRVYVLAAVLALAVPCVVGATDQPKETILSKLPPPIGKGGGGKQQAAKAQKEPVVVSLREESVSAEKMNMLGTIDNTPVVVPPETATVVHMNSQEPNRIVCPVDIKDAVFLKEKGVAVKITGKDAWVNFKFIKKGDKTLYANEPTQMYVICGPDTYNLVLVPKIDVPPSTVRLSSGLDKKIKANSDLLGGLPFEKKVMRVIKDAYTDQLAESYSTEDVRKTIGNWQELTIIHKRNIDVEGEGLRVKEYEAHLKQAQVPFKLSEKIFTKKQFANNPVAVSLEKHIVRPGEPVRVFVVEQRQEKLAKSLYPNMSTASDVNPLDESPSVTPDQVEDKDSKKKDAEGGGDDE